MKPPGWPSSMMLREAISTAAERLSGVDDTPRLDAELLAAYALGTTREQLLLHHLDDAVPEGWAALVERRAEGEPVAYIIGQRDFWTITLAVAPGVLIPRPDSETLIEAAVDHFAWEGPANVLDLGTGSGALLLAALDQWPEATGLGIDISDQAVAIARENVRRMGMESRARIIQGDWGERVEDRFDLVLCNPPYVAIGESLPASVAHYEPASALFAGSDGLDEYRRLAPLTTRLLSPRGIALFEIGASQGQAVCALFLEHGHHSRLIRDLAGRDRCVAINASMLTE